MIQNAVLVGYDTSPEKYNTETAQRGTPEFVMRAHTQAEVLRNAQRFVKGYQSPESKSKKLGTLIDCVLLTPFQFPKRYAVVPADAPKKPSKTQRNAKKPSPDTLSAIEWWDRFVERNPGEVIDQELNAAAHSAVNRLREDVLIADLIDCSRKSVMIVAEWLDEATKLVIPIKALIDILPPNDHPVFGGWILDLKTTQNASKRSFASDAMKYRYDLQAAFYLDMWNAASKENRTDFGHVILENYYPFEYRTPPPPISQRFLNFGRLSYQKAMDVYCRGIQTGKWPSYDIQGQWDVTDCADWFLDMNSLFDPIQEPEAEDEPEPAEENVDMNV